MKTVSPHRLIPGYIRFAVITLVVLMAMFTALRWVFYASFTGGQENAGLIRGAFGIGWRMDLMVSAYLLLIPFILLSLLYLSGVRSVIASRLSVWIFLLLFATALLITSADLPYYRFFKSRITTSVLLWINDFTQSMRFVFSESAFYPFLGLFAAVTAAGVFGFRRLAARTLYDVAPPPRWPYRLAVFVVAGSLLLYALRGACLYRPIGIRNAFFTNEAFINHLALNPVLTYFDSFSEFRFNEMSEQEALATTARWLDVPGGHYRSPVARPSDPDTAVAERRNIVLVLMESMSADRTGMYGGSNGLTPFLDSLARESLFFPSFYSSGIHTCNGIYGSLYGMPSIFARHPMANVASSDQRFYGLPQVLKEQGYSTVFICSHNEEFDNMGYFLPRNGFDRLVSLRDFPPALRENVWGVNDETLFRHALGIMDGLDSSGMPFLTVILTISTHPPQEMPRKTAYRPFSDRVEDQVFEYADFALRQFMAAAANRPWYDRTLFAFVGDHGLNLPSALEAPLSLNHVPFLVFDPSKSAEPGVVPGPGMQTDIFPTLMGLMHVAYVNNTLGVDLLRHVRPYAFFSQDKRLCVTDKERYYVVDKSGIEWLYRMGDDDPTNRIGAGRAVADSMKAYTYAMLQTAQYMIDNKLVGKP